MMLVAISGLSLSVAKLKRKNPQQKSARENVPQAGEDIRRHRGR
ncbi:hypothetical protein [Streptomyces sp. NPDC014006]